MISANDLQIETADNHSTPLENHLSRVVTLDGEKIAYVVILIAAVLTRFWDLGVRVMSHDESLHTQYSWWLFQGHGYSHNPMTHGPLLFHMTALSYLLFGDNDFTSRIYPAVIGILVVMFPILLRRWLGKFGALSTSFLLLISPMILYYSRYIRHDMPAILGALIMVLMIWRYMEERRFGYLVGLALGQVILYMSKEVSFIYIAIFGSFMTLYFITRLLDAAWNRQALKWIFGVSFLLLIFTGGSLGIIGIVEQKMLDGLPGESGGEAGTITPLDPNMPLDTAAAVQTTPLSGLKLAVIILLGLALLSMIVAVLIGQWPNLRRFPELDVAIVLGSLILPELTPFLIHFAGFNPLDSTPEGITRGILFTVPVFIVSIVVGLLQFMRPPAPRRRSLDLPLTEEELEEYGNTYDPETNTIEVPPDFADWTISFLSSRWWIIGAVYWLIFLFFFTTMLTNGNGIGTGIIGSLGYWLEQQDVQRGGQPWYYYLLVQIPIYEFLPAILALAAGVVGIFRWAGRSDRQTEERIEGGEANTAYTRRPLDLDAPVSFPALLFTGYWAIVNLVAYSIAGEKMPWLTTHLTTPLILLSGWVLGQTITRVNWLKLRESTNWLLLLIIPVLAVSLLRLAGPLCNVWAANPLCNTIIPESYHAPVFAGRTLTALSSTYSWLAALIVLLAASTFAVERIVRLGASSLFRLLGLFVTGWLVVLTGRAAWTASYINYDYPTEFLVYAHSSGANKEVMAQVEEISLKTLGGYALRVAYDARVSWPLTWYMRNYPNAVHFGNEPSRGLIGDAPVIIAGTSNWARIEPLVGDRYYQFEYIRMWWPMQDYFDLTWQDLRNAARDPALQRGLWEIFYSRDYDAYADAVAVYRNGNRPNFDLSQWPVPDRMRVWIRKDVFAQIWDYGVAASEIAEAVDPYAAGTRLLAPDAIFGQGLLNRPHGMAAGADGTIYVADSFNHRIAVFDQNGSLVRTLGRYVLAPEGDGFNEPWSVAVATDGTVYVADTWNHRVVVYGADGAYINSWGFEGPTLTTDVYAFWGPRGIAVDEDGNVYLADTGNKRIMVYEPDGTFIRQIGSGGPLEGQLDEPAGLAFGPDGLLYVADTWNQRIQVFTREGLFIRQWYVEAWFAQSNERPYIAVDDQGRVYVTDPDASRVIVFDAFGQYLYSFGDLSTIGLAGSVAVFGDSLFVVDTESGSVQRYTLLPEAAP